MGADSVSADKIIADVVDLIGQLTPAQRLQLQRRLRASGLLLPEANLSDRDRLALAPAVSGISLQAHRAGVHFVAPLAPRAPVPSHVEDEVKPSQPPAYRSAVSGKVVTGQPAQDDVQDPHAMAPLPGQAPERPIVIVFDGGSKGNPGQGYGSYAVRWPGQSRQIVQLQFGDRVTNNEAEYDTLIAALEAVLRRLLDNGASPETARLDIRGDSALVVNQVNGEWKCQEPRLQVRRDQARELLGRFGSWQLTHHDRKHSVALLGH